MKTTNQLTEKRLKKAAKRLRSANTHSLHSAWENYFNKIAGLLAMDSSSNLPELSQGNQLMKSIRQFIRRKNLLTIHRLLEAGDVEDAKKLVRYMLDNYDI